MFSEEPGLWGFADVGSHSGSLLKQLLNGDEYTLYKPRHVDGIKVHRKLLSLLRVIVKLSEIIFVKF